MNAEAVRATIQVGGRTVSSMGVVPGKENAYFLKVCGSHAADGEVTVLLNGMSTPYSVDEVVAFLAGEA